MRAWGGIIVAMLALAATGCDRGRVNMTGRTLSEAENVAWDTCEAWAESRALDGPDENDARITTKPDGIGIAWTESAWDNGIGAPMGCELDLTGTRLDGVLARGRVVWMPGQK